MRAIIDHVGIAVSDLGNALAFYHDALGFEVQLPEAVASQRVRAHFLVAGDEDNEAATAAGVEVAGAPMASARRPDGAAVKLELLEATDEHSPIARYMAK